MGTTIGRAGAILQKLSVGGPLCTEDQLQNPSDVLARRARNDGSGLSQPAPNVRFGVTGDWSCRAIPTCRSALRSRGRGPPFWRVVRRPSGCARSSTRVRLAAPRAPAAERGPVCFAAGTGGLRPCSCCSARNGTSATPSNTHASPIFGAARSRWSLSIGGGRVFSGAPSSLSRWHRARGSDSLTPAEWTSLTRFWAKVRSTSFSGADWGSRSPPWTTTLRSLGSSAASPRWVGSSGWIPGTPGCPTGGRPLDCSTPMSSPPMLSQFSMPWDRTGPSSSHPMWRPPAASPWPPRAPIAGPERGLRSDLP